MTGPYRFAYRATPTSSATHAPKLPTRALSEMNNYWVKAKAE